MRLEQLGRKPAYRVMVGPVTLYFSYATLIGVNAPSGGYRDEASYSRTTAKHMGQLGIGGWQKVPNSELERIALRAIALQALA